MENLPSTHLAPKDPVWSFCQFYLNHPVCDQVQGWLNPQVLAASVVLQHLVLFFQSAAAAVVVLLPSSAFFVSPLPHPVLYPNLPAHNDQSHSHHSVCVHACSCVHVLVHTPVGREQVCTLINTSGFLQALISFMVICRISCIKKKKIRNVI